jgi:hypothetical protein
MLGSEGVTRSTEKKERVEKKHTRKINRASEIDREEDMIVLI